MHTHAPFENGSIIDQKKQGGDRCHGPDSNSQNRNRQTEETYKKGVRMQSIMLKAKIHQARVTHSVLDYEGSCAIDGALLEMTGLREFEQIQIYNITNGNRFTTYIIRGEDGSGIISVNGAAARLADVGDKIIIAAYGNYDEKELETKFGI